MKELNKENERNTQNKLEKREKSKQVKENSNALKYKNIYCNIYNRNI
jgi:hypothetical protein